MNKSIETSKINFLDPNPDGKMPVLLLHGLGSDATSWQLQMDYLLANGLRPIAIDLPGFGESICNPELWSLKYCAQSCNQLMDSLSINHYDVIGISMGGVVAQIMALDYSERVNRLVLINTFACLRPQKWDEWYYLIKRYLIAKIRGKNIQAQLVAKRLFPEPDQELYRKEIIKQKGGGKK